MNENDVREMFQRREGDVHAPASTPQRLVAHTRRREWLTAGVGVATAIIVVIVSIAGLRSLRSSDGSQPGDVGPTATKTVSGITITYPERWFAEDPVAIGIEPNDTPRTLPTLVLTLTRDDPQMQGVLGCPRLALIDGQVLMTVQETPLAISGEASAPWPVPLRSVDLGSDQPGGCYEGWTFMRAGWTAAGRSFEARVGFASDASDTDRGAMTDAYSSMTFAPGSVSTEDKAQVAAGVADSGATWSLTASRTGDLCWDIQVETDGRGTGTGACLTGKSGDAPSLVPVHVAPSTTVIAGTIPEDAVVVEIDILDPQTAQTGIYQNPPMFPAPSDAWGDVRFMVFAVPGTIPMGSVRVRFQDLQGNDLYARQVIEW